MMNESTKSEKRSTRRLTLAAAAMLTIALSVFGGLFYLQRQATSGRQRLTQAEVDARYQPSEKQLEQRMTKAEWLREKWRPWALEHKDLLQAMLKAKADDREMLNKVWDMLPLNPAKLGIKPEDLVNRKLDPVEVPWWSWSPLGKSRLLGTPKQLEREEKHKLRRAQRQQKEFADLRDVRLASCPMPGGSTLYLWTSGRITKTENVPKTITFQHNGKTVTGTTGEDGPHKEIVPPYEFLK